MRTRPIVGRLAFYTVPHGAEKTEAGLYECIATGCHESAVYREPDPDMILVWCESHADPTKAETYEFLGYGQTA